MRLLSLWSFSLLLSAIALHQPPQSRILNSLYSGKWIKLICGASNQEVVTVRNLCLVYSIAGVDCIDIAADRAVVEAASEGIKVAQRLFGVEKPYLMVSINDGNDAHFRKAFFDPLQCPLDCPRPCEKSCPALAIDQHGVVQDRCYGCGRCVKVCPYRLITEEARTISPQTIRDLLQLTNPSSSSLSSSQHMTFHRDTCLIDAIEIHTNQNHELLFHSLLQDIGDDVFQRLKLLSISFPEFGEKETLDFISSLQEIIHGHRSWGRFEGVQMWQTDGNPMSGDILKIPSYRSFSLARSLLTSKDERLNQAVDFSKRKHFVQLSGGINDISIQAAKQLPFSQVEGFGGYGLGGFARKIMLEDLLTLGGDGSGHLEDSHKILDKVLKKAENIVKLVKS